MKKPTILTTNKSPFNEWGEALPDRDLAEAIVDRILEKDRIILPDGTSARTRYLEGIGNQDGMIDKGAISHFYSSVIDAFFKRMRGISSYSQIYN